MDPGESLTINAGDILGGDPQDEFSSDEDDEAEEKKREKEIQESLKGAFDDLIDDDEDEQSSELSKDGEFEEKLPGDMVNGQMQNQLPEHVHRTPLFTSTPKAEEFAKRVRFQEHLNEVNLIPNLGDLLNASAETSQQSSPDLDPEIPSSGNHHIDEKANKENEDHDAELPENGGIQADWNDPHESKQVGTMHDRNGMDQVQQGNDRFIHSPFHPLHNNWLNDTSVPMSTVTTRTIETPSNGHGGAFTRPYSRHHGGSGDADRKGLSNLHPNGMIDAASFPPDEAYAGDPAVQFRALYMARGREVENLQSELEQVRDKSRQDMALLRTQLLMSKGEQESMAYSLQQIRVVLNEQEELNHSLEGKIAALEVQLDAEKKAKTEVIQKLKASETTIESLRQQLNDLARSENISRAREQNEATLTALKQRHQQEVLHLQEIIDNTKHQLQSTKDELSEVQENLRKQVALYEKAQLERAETMSRLTKSLEASQRQYQEVLESGKLQEVSYLKSELQRVCKEKYDQEEQLKLLKDEVISLRSELQVFERVTLLGEGSPRNHESSARLGFRTQTSQWEADDLTSLKSELERSMTALRSKRNLVAQLQSQLEVLQKELVQAHEKTKQAEEKMQNSLKSKPSGGSPEPSNAVLHTELEKEVLQLRNALLEKDVQIKELTAKYNEAVEKEKQLQELNSKMTREYEEDKKKALAECCETYLKLHSEALNKVQQKLDSASQDKAKLTERYDAQITMLRTQNQKLADHLGEVKRLYIRVCEEKNNLESKLHELAELQSKGHEVEEEIVNQKCTMMLQEAKLMWQEESEAKFIKLMETELKRTKEEAKKQKMNEIAEAIRNTKAECKKMLEEQIQKEYAELTNRLLKSGYTAESKTEEQKEEVKMELLGHVYKMASSLMIKQKQDLETMVANQLKNAEEKQQTLQMQLVDAIKKHEQEKEEARRELEKLRNDFSHLQLKLEKKNAELDRVKADTNDSKDSQTALASLKQEVEQLTNEKTELLKEKDSLTSTIFRREQELAKSHSETKTIKEKLMKYYKLTQNLEKRCQGLDKLKEECTMQIELQKKSMMSQHEEDLNQLRKEHEAYLTSLMQRFEEEKQELISKVNESSKTPDQQHENERISQLALKKLQEIYITSLDKIQARLMEHLNEVNKHASLVVRKTLKEYKQQIIQKALTASESSTKAQNHGFHLNSSNSQSNPEIASTTKQRTAGSSKQNPTSPHHNPYNQFNIPSILKSVPNYRSSSHDRGHRKRATAVPIKASDDINLGKLLDSDCHQLYTRNYSPVSEDYTEYRSPPDIRSAGDYPEVTSVFTRTYDTPLLTKFQWPKLSTASSWERFWSSHLYDQHPERLIPSPEPVKSSTQSKLSNQKAKFMMSNGGDERRKAV